MNVKNLLRKILPVAVMLALIVIIFVSCRKKDSDYNIVSVDPVTSETPAVFRNKPIRILSDYEIANQVEFPAHIIRRLGNGLVGGEDHEIENPFKEIGKTLWEIHDYKHTEHEFTDINQGLTNLTGQIAALNTTMTNMGQHLGIQIDNLTAFISSGDLNTQIGYVRTAMGSATEDEFMFYSKTAAAWEADSLNPARIAQMNTLGAYVTTYAANVYHNQTTNSMTNIIEAMYQDVCPTLGTGSNALQAYANTLIPLCKGKINDSSDAMHAYMLLESYFLTVLNYQLQAATIMRNACNVIDSTGSLGYDTSFWNTSVVPNIKNEVDVFISTVDYLVANMGEYRNQARFIRDMQYASAGLAPDDNFIHVLARSQFVANLLYDAMGLQYPVMCGHIVIPLNYGNNPTGALTVTIGSRSVFALPTQIKSQLPYTYWTNTTCHPDNTWNSYRFGTLGTPDPGWPAGNQTIQVNVGNSQTPWVHFTPITGNITTLYYNPRNPNQTSTTQTAECTIEFAYFSANWQWGYLLLSNSTLNSGWKKTTDGGAFDFESFNSGLVGSMMSVPFAGTGKGQNLTYAMSAISFTTPNNIPGTMKVSGTTSHSPNYYVIVDGNWLGVTSGPDMPPVSGTLQGWASYNVIYGMQGTGGVDLTVNIGTTLPTEHHYNWSGVEYYTIGGEVVRTNFHDLSGTLNTGFGSSANLSAGKGYQPGIQYYYQTANLASAVPASITLNQSYQFVYGGYYNLP